MTIDKKVEALTNALKSFNFPQWCYIETSDKRLGHRFAIAKKGEHGTVSILTNFVNYEEMNCFLMGYNKALTNPFN